MSELAGSPSSDDGYHRLVTVYLNAKLMRGLRALARRRQVTTETRRLIAAYEIADLEHLYAYDRRLLCDDLLLPGDATKTGVSRGRTTVLRRLRRRSSNAEVAELAEAQAQELVPLGEWGFKSPLPHQ